MEDTQIRQGALNIHSNVLISAPIKFMIKGFPGECLDASKETINKYFNEDCTYNWKEIQNLLPGDFADLKLTYDFGASCVVKLRSIWMHSEAYYSRLLQSNYDYFADFTKLTNSSELLWNFLLAENKDTSTIENLLLITSILENSLGNVYFTLAGKSPPHLLKDLLNSHELEDLFGAFAIFFLKILLGSAYCVNIRNILWHGFCSVNDVPSYYPAVLILCIGSLSKILKKSKIEIVPRMKTPFPASFFEKIESFNEKSKLQKGLIYIEGSLSTSIIPATHIELWKRLYELYRSESYMRFIFLMLPQIELLFRIIYGSLNQVDVAAKFDEYYIIMDTIFKEMTHDLRMNKIFSAFSEGVLKLTYDLFISPLGPRIRDKISHGEIDMSSIDGRYCCNALLNLSLCIMSNEFNLDDYESLCHPNSCLWSNILSAEAQILKIRSMEIPEPLKCDAGSYPSPYDSGYFAKSSGRRRIKIFLRPAKESEIVTYLGNIVEYVNLACCNLVDSLEEKIEMYEKRTLRSKRRKTLTKILQNLSKTMAVLEDSLNFTKNIFFKLQSNGEILLAHHGGSLLKFVKQVSTLVMNLSKYCHKQSNEWERCGIVSLKFYELLKENKDLFK